MGSAAAVDLATKQEVDIVLDRGITTMSHVAEKLAPLGLKTMAKVAFQSFAHFDNLSKLGDVKGNVLIAQEQENQALGPRLNRAASSNTLGETANKKQVMFLENVTHHHHHRFSAWISSDKIQPQHAESLKKFLGVEKRNKCF